MPHVQIDHPGAPLRYVADDADLSPGPGEIVVRQHAAGLNFVDAYHRTGRYPLPAYPAILGVEGVGVVDAIGPAGPAREPAAATGVARDAAEVAGVVGAPERTLAVGDRVAYAGALGAYASRRALPAWRAIRLPAAIDDATAATLFARGMTVHMLQHRIHAVTAGTTVLVLSAAGGLGSMLARAAKRAGATVIATVGSAAKVELARAAGADHVLVGRDRDFAPAVAELTGGRGVDVAYDGVGGTTLRQTLGCVRPFGTIASFGEAGGAIPALPVEELGPRRSLILARPSVMHYMQDRATYVAAAPAVLAAALDGVTPTPGRAYPLSAAADAHRDLEAGATTGAAYLIVA